MSCLLSSHIAPFSLFVPQVEGVVLRRMVSRLLEDITECLCVNSSHVLMSIFTALTIVLRVAFDHALDAPEVGTF